MSTPGQSHDQNPLPPRGSVDNRSGRQRVDEVLVAVLIGGFLVRFVLAPWNSYWLDELYSVATYGVWNDSLSAMIQRLGETSVHPPLYQTLLYLWMQAFGDTELATRTLSNLSVAGATAFLYGIVKPRYGRGPALWSAVGLTLMYSAVYYGLETRSYGFTMFLAAGSSYFLLGILEPGRVIGWSTALRSWRAVGLLVFNAALLLTHYYNVFLLAAQGVIALVVILREARLRGWVRPLGFLALAYALPAAVFWTLWSKYALATFENQASNFEVEDPSEIAGVLDLLRGAVLRDNLSLPRPAYFILLIPLSLAVFSSLRNIVRAGADDDERARGWTVLYLIGWLALPLLVASVGFLVLGAQRVSNRYFIYCTVPIVPVLVVAFYEARRWVRERGINNRFVDALPSIAIVGVLVLGILPGFLGAVSHTKVDWRGIAREIVQIVENDPDSSYVVFETSFRATPVLDYYFDRFSGGSVKVAATIQRHRERSGMSFSFERRPEVFEGADYVIVAFTHHQASSFPRALETLGRLYDEHFRRLDHNGRGLVIFRTS